MDILLDLATAPTGDSVIWKNKKIKWAELVSKLSKPYHTNHTFKAYMGFNKEEQGKIKDVGAYFGGYIRTGRRLKSNILHRQIVTLDIDFAYSSFWQTFELMYDCAAYIHSTHKHCEESPRFRLLIPLAREVTPDEYVAIARSIAGSLGIDLFDGTTFDINRFMYWQSSPSDVQYYFREQKGAFINPDDVLSEYVDWTDVSQYPRSKNEKLSDRKRVDKAENPTEKKGIIGAFCRTYGIVEAVEKYLSETYEVLEGSRMTYKKGTTSGGVVIYDNLFSYSHHNTDPTSGTLVNAYDLVRMHKFEGESDVKSVTLMQELILKDKDVKKLIASEKLSQTVSDFEGLIEESDPEENDWMQNLEVDPKGKYLSTAGNFTKVLKNDVRLKDVFKYNTLANRIYVTKPLPWRNVEGEKPQKNVDYAGMRNYLERLYGIQAPSKIEDAVLLIADQNQYHPVVNYLNGLSWDGENRIDNMFQYWLGAENSEYTKQAARLMLVSAVTRAFNEGSKIDNVIVLVGAEGVGKSEIISKLGQEWYSETLTTVQGVSAMEQIQGYWIIEISELTGLRKADQETQKAFISKKKDSYRPSYGRVVEDYGRGCIFVATTNLLDFLKNMNQNRRFVPVKVKVTEPIDTPFNMSKSYVDQIWAEAVGLYITEGVNFIKDLAKHQAPFLDIDPRLALVEEFLKQTVSDDWKSMSISEKLLFREMNSEGTEMLKEVCPIELFVECFNKKKDDITRAETKSIKDILVLLGWAECETPKRFKDYGTQRYFTKI